MLKLRERAEVIFARELELSRSAMQWGGLIGFIAHPLYFFIWTYLLPQPYDSWWLRISASLLCVPMMFQRYCPKRFEHYMLIYWHFCLIYVLPFVCTFLAVKNEFSTMWMMTEVMIIFIMALCIDFPVLLMVYILVGMLGGFAAAVWTSPMPPLLSEIDQANLALLPIVILCSMAFSHVFQQGRLFQKGRLFEKERLFSEKNKAMQALAGSIGHEMRNPLGQIKHSLESIEHILLAPMHTNATQPFTERVLDDLYRHVAQGQLVVTRGLQVISMILDEVQDKSFDASTFSYMVASEVTQKAIDEYGYESDSERERVCMTVVRDFTFKGMETAYLFTLFNLIKNAVYYFKLHSSATISITVESPTIRVRDTGPGIAPGYLQHLFDAFETSGKSGGTGLGLPYCRRIVSAFGGSIACRSVVGEFTEFTMAFPVVAKDQYESHQKQLKEHAEALLRNKRILIVDDDALVRRVTAHMLHKAEMVTDVAENGHAALEKLQYGQFDAIVLDINMPQLNGYETAEKVRSGSIPNAQSIPILCYSSESANIIKAKARRAGMDGFLVKPCSQGDLIRELANVIGQRSGRLRPEVAAPTFADKVVLLAEDSNFNRIIVTEYLQRWGIKVLAAEHGQAVLDILASKEPVHLILMDLHMPGMDGLQTTRAIRASGAAYGNIPIIALTGDFDEASVEQAYASGMNDFISKPVDISTLCEKLNRQFSAEGGTVEAIVVPVAAPPIDDETAVLDAKRLDELRRIGMLEDIPSYLNKMRDLLDQLPAAKNAGDFTAMHRVLHSMLGLSGEVGASALHQAIRLAYPTIKAGRFPENEDWCDHIVVQHQRTEAALRNERQRTNDLTPPRRLHS
jgi:CheY-like chemotaxis protein